MRVIELTKGQVAIVDDEDFDELAQYRWHCSNGYAARQVKTQSGGKKRIFMHNVIMGVPARTGVDHKNGNSLDNRRDNLRPADVFQNAANRKISKNNKVGFKGVFYRPACKQRPYRACIWSKGKNFPLGYFKTAEEAHAAYCAAAKEHFGEFARFN